MNDLDRLLKARNIPDPLIGKDGSRITTAEAFDARKPSIRNLLQEQEYGVIPKKPEHLDVQIIECDQGFAAGKATLTKIRFTATNGQDTFSFPVYANVPSKHTEKLPAFVFINFRDNIPDKYYPAEEIIDRGYAVFSFYYNDITGDENNFSDPGAKFLGQNRHAKNAPGKIAMWAWAAMRVFDYLETRKDIDLSRVAVIGHSRLGKTALVTAAFDERFAFAISNDSGCSGAAITRGKVGEAKEDIVRVFPYWFCPRYNEPTKIEDLPFEQNYLLALIAPRHILVGSAELDEWADPRSEFLNLYMTNDIYRLYGKQGLVTEDRIPEAKAVLSEGDALYQIRHGKHFLSREDWNCYMDFMDHYGK